MKNRLKKNKKKKEKKEKRKNKTTKYQRQTPASFFTIFKSSYLKSKISLPQLRKNKADIQFPQQRTYVGEKAGVIFLDYVTEVANKLYYNYICKPKKMTMTEADRQAHEISTTCGICNKELLRPQHHACVNAECHLCILNEQAMNNKVVRHHDHYSGEFISSAHSQCNIKLQQCIKRWKLNVYFHSLASYDAHIIMRSIRQRHGHVEIIPRNSEKYICIMVGRVRFLDSCNFLPHKLEDIALSTDVNAMHETMRLAGYDEYKFQLIREKGIFFLRLLNQH